MNIDGVNLHKFGNVLYIDVGNLSAKESIQFVDDLKSGLYSLEVFVGLNIDFVEKKNDIM